VFNRTLHTLLSGTLLTCATHDIHQGVEPPNINVRNWLTRTICLFPNERFRKTEPFEQGISFTWFQARRVIWRSIMIATYMCCTRFKSMVEPQNITIRNWLRRTDYPLIPDERFRKTEPFNLNKTFFIWFLACQFIQKSIMIAIYMLFIKGWTSQHYC